MKFHNVLTESPLRDIGSVLNLIAVTCNCHGRVQVLTGVYLWQTNPPTHIHLMLINFSDVMPKLSTMSLWCDALPFIPKIVHNSLGGLYAYHESWLKFSL
jgi:hypothetical protein